MAGPRITCGNCGDIIRSTHRHDWRPCRCFKNEEDNKGCFIDGGDDYTRIGGSNWKFTAVPCPFCGALSDLELDQSDSNHTHVVCGKCGARGPATLEQGETDSFYWDHWNERMEKK